MKLFLRTITGEPFDSQNFSESSLIQDVKKSLHPFFASQSINLCHKGRILSDERRTLQECGVKEGGLLVISGRRFNNTNTHNTITSAASTGSPLLSATANANSNPRLDDNPTVRSPAKTTSPSLEPTALGRTGSGGIVIGGERRMNLDTFASSMERRRDGERPANIVFANSQNNSNNPNNNNNNNNIINGTGGGTMTMTAHELLRSRSNSTASSSENGPRRVGNDNSQTCEPQNDGTANIRSGTNGAVAAAASSSSSSSTSSNDSFGRETREVVSRQPEQNNSAPAPPLAARAPSPPPPPPVPPMVRTTTTTSNNSSTAAGGFTVSSAAVASILSMGFSDTASINNALRRTNNNVEAAIEILLS